MIELRKYSVSDIKIIPRGFNRLVFIDEAAYEAIKNAQKLLNPHIKLIITRGYQPENWPIKYMRLIGAKVFEFIYPGRKSEIPEIFGHNGHATDGTHIDIGIEYNGQVLNLLPASVFTKLNTVENISKHYFQIIKDVLNALQECGFAIHSNKIEAMQIHCDFIAKPQ